MNRHDQDEGAHRNRPESREHERGEASHERGASPRGGENRERHDEGAGYASVRRPPTEDPGGVGPGGYAPRASPSGSYRAGSEAGYGQRYGSGSAEGSFGRGMDPRGHQGRGPRGFVRSDGRLIEEISERMYDDPDLDASDVGVSVEQGVATLEGSVQQRWMKHRAEDIAAHCGGVSDVVNHIKVVPGPR